MTAPDPAEVEAALKMPIGKILAAHPFDIDACACGGQIGQGWPAWIAHVVRQPVPGQPKTKRPPRPVLPPVDGDPRTQARFSADN